MEDARIRVEAKQKKNKDERGVLEIEEGKKVLNIVLRADVGGTLEAIHEVLRGIENDEITIRILSESTGEIMESDIKLASTAHALIVGFRVKINQSAEGFARQMKVEVVTGDIIYHLVEDIRTKLAEFLSTEIKEVDLGKLKVLAIFRTEKSRMIVGGKVIEGELRKSAKLRVAREEDVLNAGRIVQLKIQDKAVEKVEKGQECGVLLEGPEKIQVGDILEAYERQESKIQL